MNPSEIKIDRTSLMIFLNYAVRESHRFYADPENVKRFEAWKAERDAKKEEAIS